jgi:hypothetical protein
MRVRAIIELDVKPESREHAQWVLNNDTKFRPYTIHVEEVL